jgi:hypothetical protein
VSGTVKRLEEHFGSKMGWLGCSHHWLELIIGELLKSLFGDTTSPEDSFCKKFKNWWNDVAPNTISGRKLPATKKKLVKGGPMIRQTLNG